jgi:hypothetical protein
MSKQSSTVISDPTMTASTTFEYLLSSVKSSNLNFHSHQSPFSAVISLKKTFIEDKFGNQLEPPHLDSQIIKQLESENHALHDRIDKLENYSTFLQNDQEMSVDECEKLYKSNEKLEK